MTNLRFNGGSSCKTFFLPLPVPGCFFRRFGNTTISTVCDYFPEYSPNKIRRRAQLPELSGLSKERFREAIWKERWHELSYENKTWFDMARLRKAFNVTTRAFDDFVGHKFYYGPVLKDRELLFPIPTAEIRNNKNLTQNSGY